MGGIRDDDKCDIIFFSKVSGYKKMCNLLFYLGDEW